MLALWVYNLSFLWQDYQFDALAEKIIKDTLIGRRGQYVYLLLP